MKKLKFFSAILALTALLSNSASVFAANPYGIEYSGGNALGASNVQINPTLVNELSFLAGSNSGAKLDFSKNARWEHGYMRAWDCFEVYYLRFWSSNLINPSEDIYYDISSDKYTARVDFNNIALDGITDTSATNALAVGIDVASGGIEAGRPVFTDAECTNRVNEVKTINLNTEGQMFFQTNIKLFKKGSDKVFTSNNLYFALTDVDNAQSFKILNPSNELSYENMYAKSVEDLQSSDLTFPYKNMFVPNNNYIYSQYGSTSPYALDTSASNVYVKVNQESQQEGINLVLGFAGTAGSGIQYYAKQYTVTYESDEHGTITGITDEQVISGDTPSGSTEEAKDGYELDYWKADKDVTLTDGTAIKAGEPITPEQVKQVVVSEDVTFTAIHKTKVKVPNTGASTQELNGTFVSLSIIGIAIGALMIGLLPRLTHKKVKFN